MEILSFDIKGKFAHFRKFHGNNTALSYSIPPRTTIIGILASILGLEKDSYYQDFSHLNLKVGVQVLNPIKKSFHRLNYMRIGKSPSNSDFRGASSRKTKKSQTGPVQTPFEVVTGYDLKKDSVCYRIYLAEGENRYPFQTIKDYLLIENHQPSFNLSLGIAGFNANIENVEVYSVKEKEANKERILLFSGGNSDQITQLYFEEDDFSFNHIEEELLPADFEGGEKGRDLAEMNRVLFATRPFPMQVELTGKYYEITHNNEIENIQFLEYVSVLAQQEK